MKSPALLILISLCLFSSGTRADAALKLHQLLDEHWARANQEQVFFRTDPDTYRPHGALAEVSARGRERRRQFNEEMLGRLAAIDASTLTGQDRISYQLFRYERETERASYDSQDHLFPFTSLFGYHTYFAAAPANMAFSTLEDYERLLISLADFPRYNAEYMQSLREAIEKGYTHYCESISDYGQTITELIVQDARQSSLYAPFENIHQTVPAADAKHLRARAHELIADAVLPAYQELNQLFRESYLPACRKQPGIGSLPGGAEYYTYLLRYFTTTDMTPQETHQLGLQETHRIRAEMQAIIEQTGFGGGFRQFLDYLRTDQQFYASDAEDLLEKTALIAKRMDGQMPRFFRTLPRNTYEIRPAEGRGAYYVSGPADGSSAGIYFINTSDPGKQPLYNLEALTLHEAVPGHHHQATLALELDLPAFRRTLYHAAYGEGWGLYAESLGKEAGFYTDPYSDFGRLTYEMWRANRLVVDTGLHAFGWSRQRAIDYLMQNTALTEAEVTAEVDRYITWPGQATAYKIGELRIKAMRARAEQALGSDFDLRSFHDVVVGNGSVAIAILEEIVDEWINSLLRVREG
ncbi:DUF885 domain-containing protein [Pseudohalioglobus lutimaris]|nr:DUF885 domain-containing protein [Pseudohalioglobus lutimaris]